MKTVSLAIGIHNHQPIGNFDSVMEEAYQNAYLPFLREMQKHPAISFAIHNSGCLLDWIESRHPEMIDILRKMVGKNQIEILGGGYYEPIMTIIPERDRIGQVRMFRERLESLFGTDVKGAWLAERVWEQFITKSLAESGVSYTMLDDTHFRSAGLTQEKLLGYYTTEDSGKTVAVFPMSERLRYLIPFRNPEETVNYLRAFASEDGKNLVVYADDGEKFGVWPGTHKHCYTDGWLSKFLTLLEENSDWIRIILFRDALREFNLGKIYLPDCSYREMGEWALYPQARELYDTAVSVLKERGIYEKAGFTLRGGTWRNFRAKYPEANRLYAKMLEVSEAVSKSSPQVKDEATRLLYKGQCNDAYWHGIFGGLYLPHLRTAAYENLIAAEKLAQPITDLTAQKRDFDADSEPEFRLGSAKLNAYFNSDYCLSLYELDVKEKNFNLLNTLTRREEFYHREITKRAGERNVEHAKAGEIPSIHESASGAAEGEDFKKIIAYDRYDRTSFIHHFLKPETPLKELIRCDYEEAHFIHHKEPQFELAQETGARSKKVSLIGDFSGDLNASWLGPEALPIELKKTATLPEKGDCLVFEVALTNSSGKRLDCLFALEFNLALLSDRDTQKWYRFGDDNATLPLSIKGVFEKKEFLGVNDKRIGLQLRFDLSAPADIALFPVHTVSHSEKGLEEVYQCSCIFFLWRVLTQPDQKWVRSVKFYVRAV
jgi:alpha-amylase